MAPAPALRLSCRHSRIHLPQPTVRHHHNRDNRVCFAGAPILCDSVRQRLSATHRLVDLGPRLAVGTLEASTVLRADDLIRALPDPFVWPIQGLVWGDT